MTPSTPAPALGRSAAAKHATPREEGTSRSVYCQAAWSFLLRSSLAKKTTATPRPTRRSRRKPWLKSALRFVGCWTGAAAAAAATKHEQTTRRRRKKKKGGGVHKREKELGTEKCIGRIKIARLRGQQAKKKGHGGHEIGGLLKIEDGLGSECVTLQRERQRGKGGPSDDHKTHGQEVKGLGGRGAREEEVNARRQHQRGGLDDRRPHEDLLQPQCRLRTHGTGGGGCEPVGGTLQKTTATTKIAPCNADVLGATRAHMRPGKSASFRPAAPPLPDPTWLYVT